MIYWELFLGFLKVGFFSFGGAYGAIALIRDVVGQYGWLPEETLTYMIAVSESTPGPIMVNLATYVGSSQAGFWGAVLATLTVVFPSFVIILLVMVALKSALKNVYVQGALAGLKPCVTGIILATGCAMVLGNLSSPAEDARPLLLTGILTALLFGAEPVLKKKLSPITFILISAVLGIAVYGF